MSLTKTDSQITPRDLKNAEDRSDAADRRRAAATRLSSPEARAAREAARAQRTPAVEAVKPLKQRIRQLEAEEAPLLAEAEADAVEDRAVQEKVTWAERRREKALARSEKLAQIAREKADTGQEMKRIYAEQGMQEAHEKAAALYPDVVQRARDAANSDPAIPSEDAVRVQALGKLSEVLGVSLPAKLFNVEWSGSFLTTARVPEFNCRFVVVTEWDQALLRWTSRVTAQAPEAAPTHFYDLDGPADFDVIAREHPVR